MQALYGCHTVILYGSRARGDATAESDYDVLGVRDSGEAIRDARPRA
jgi:predicted nucleotidyltransferase